MTNEHRGLDANHGSSRGDAADMHNDGRYPWLPLAVLVSALILWTILLALGAYLEWGADEPRRDIRKPLIMLGSLGMFLALWAAAYWLRSRRLRRKGRLPRDGPT